MACVPFAEAGIYSASQNVGQTSRQFTMAIEVLIIGGGIGGLTLGLPLHRAGIACRVYAIHSIWGSICGEA